ncbi:YTH domain-containing protein ECT4-like isoform X2 [Rutidosis leptorrhynchoides]|uniref:YTH domain-containing protein ECT4-like isoform X2 n=1 Tax=Rutidosis leptorrhynchoides TaxID=125765 RepID=UPI003A99894B
MATVAPADQAADLLKNLSLESQSKTLEIPEPTKKPSGNSVDTGNGQIQSLDRSGTPLIPDYMDPTVAYFPNYASTAYYYPGYDGATNDWDDYSRYLNSDGVDMSHGVYSDMYHGYGYAPYGPYSPAASPVPVGHDGQLYAAQQYQYPSPYFQPMTATSGPYSKGENAPSAGADRQPWTVDTANTNSNSIVGVKGTTGPAPLRPTTYTNSAFNGNGSYGNGAQNGYQDARYGLDGVLSPIPWLDVPSYSNGPARNNSSIAPVLNGNGISSRNQNLRPHSHMGLQSPRPISGVNTATGYMNRMYPNKLYGQYGSNYRSGYGYGSNTYDSQNGRGWLATDNKYKPRGRVNSFFGYNNENGDGLNELNRGPRARIIKNQKVLTPITLTTKGQIITSTPTDRIEKEPEVIEKVSSVPDREQYNLLDFPDTYEDAKFFIIKSYSEDDVHKSIKYNVWSSTQNGNKKLDAAYQEAQLKSGPCPVFLFFSVNTSGQFVGVAEMVGPVDFDKRLEYWQQDKWVGCFPLKWHIVKDLPNSLLKHITLENNENKPVTNSRDTQEVKLEQGLQVIKVFKEHSSKQCILDDFEFYEDRQKRIQEKKAKQQQFQKQVWEGKPKEGVKVEIAPPKSTETPEEIAKDATSVHVNGDVKPANGC